MDGQQKGNKKKEGMVLALVAVVGIAGLVLLQFIRKGGEDVADNKTVVQNQHTNTPAATVQTETIQKLPANLLRVNEQPEMNMPFVFELADFSSSGTYQLDPGDGAALQTFSNGKLSYTYHRPGTFSVSIYVLDNVTPQKFLMVSKQVANLTQKEGTNKKTGKPVVDF